MATSVLFYVGSRGGEVLLFVGKMGFVDEQISLAESIHVGRQTISTLSSIPNLETLENVDMIRVCFVGGEFVVRRSVRRVA